MISCPNSGMLHSLSVGHESERSVSHIGMGITSRRGMVAWNYPAFTG